jgi:protein gp37
MKRGGPFSVAEMAKVEPYVDDHELRALLSTRRLPAGSKVFIEDMSDLFGPWVTDEMLVRCFAVFASRPDVIIQLLTKRPERMRAFLSNPDTAMRVFRALPEPPHRRFTWPLANVWLGTSVEDQPNADTRIPELLATPAPVRFLSCEPLLGPVSVVGGLHAIQWVILGSESGPKRREMSIAWAGWLVEQCRAAGVACFVKQISTPSDPHGGNSIHWPPGDWPREFPDGAEYVTSRNGIRRAK